MAINFLNNIASIGALTITRATTDPLLYLYNTTNGSGSTIRFSDQTASSQVGDITYFHSDGSSQGGGASFHFRSEPDTVVVAGGPSNTGRFVSKSKNDVTEVDYGFYDDVNTGMYRAAADTVRLVGGGVYNLSVSATNAALYYQSGLRFQTTSSGAKVEGGLIIEGASDTMLTLNQTGTDTGWSYINFNTLGTRNYYVGQDSSKNFNIYNDNIDVVAISVSYASNLTTIGGDLTVAGGDIVLSGTGRIQGVDTVSVSTDAANKLYVDNAVAGVPIGNYLPLSAGSGSPLTGDLWLDDNSGASPSLYLQNGSNNYWRLINGSTGIFSLKEGTSDRITILPGGNVGIGTTSPGAKFTTSGVIMAIANDNAYNAGYFAKLSSDHGANSLKLTSRTGDVFLASDYGASVTLQVGNPNVPALYINASKTVQFNGYDSTNQTGTPTYILGTDASGNVVKVLGSNIPTAAPATPGSLVATIVGETIEIAFAQSSTSNIGYYQVWSSDDGGDYGLIAQVTPTDFSATMTVVDTTFVTGGTMSYRVFAVKNGVYSSPGTVSKAYTVGALSVTNMTVVNLNTAYYIQYEKPTTRFIDHIEIWMDSQTTSAALLRSNAVLVYSGQNASYMRNVNTSSNFHQFWVEIVTS